MEYKTKRLKTIKRPFDPRRYRLGMCPPRPPESEHGEQWTFLGWYHDQEYIYFQWGVLDDSPTVH
ncbi:MAG: hypothetical protein AB1697_06750 [Pseudomonadota bacterium]